MCGKTLKQAIITVCLLLGLSFCYCLQVSAAGGTTNQADYHDINNGLERIEDRMGQAETGLSAAQTEIYNADSELRGAAEAAGSIADKTRKNREILNECDDIINRSEERTARIEVIIRRVEERNKENGAQTSGHT